MYFSSVTLTLTTFRGPLPHQRPAPSTRADAHELPTRRRRLLYVSPTDGPRQTPTLPFQPPLRREVGGEDLRTLKGVSSWTSLPSH